MTSQDPGQGWTPWISRREARGRAGQMARGRAQEDKFPDNRARKIAAFPRLGGTRDLVWVRSERPSPRQSHTVTHCPLPALPACVPGSLQALGPGGWAHSPAAARVPQQAGEQLQRTHPRSTGQFGSSGWGALQGGGGAGRSPSPAGPSGRLNHQAAAPSRTPGALRWGASGSAGSGGEKPAPGLRRGHGAPRPAKRSLGLSRPWPPSLPSKAGGAGARQGREGLAGRGRGAESVGSLGQSLPDSPIAPFSTMGPH